MKKSLILELTSFAASLEAASSLRVFEVLEERSADGSVKTLGLKGRSRVRRVAQLADEVLAGRAHLGQVEARYTGLRLLEAVDPGATVTCLWLLSPSSPAWEPLPQDTTALSRAGWSRRQFQTWKELALLRSRQTRVKAGLQEPTLLRMAFEFEQEVNDEVVLDWIASLLARSAEKAALPPDVRIYGHSAPPWGEESVELVLSRFRPDPLAVHHRFIESRRYLGGREKECLTLRQALDGSVVSRSIELPPAGGDRLLLLDLSDEHANKVRQDGKFAAYFISPFSPRIA